MFNFLLRQTRGFYYESFNMGIPLVVVNLIAFLWPNQIILNESEHQKYLLLITHYFNPLILFLYLIIYLINGKSLYLTRILYISLLYSMFAIISSLMGNEPTKNIFIAILFPLSSISITNVYRHYYLRSKINITLTKFLIIWASLPVVMLMF